MCFSMKSDENIVNEVYELYTKGVINIEVDQQEVEKINSFMPSIEEIQNIENSKNDEKMEDNTEDDLSSPFTIKLADFGLSKRIIFPKSRYPQICTSTTCCIS